MKLTEELRQTVALSLVGNMGPAAFKALIEKYKRPSALFKASEKELLKMNGLKRVNLREIKDPKLFEKADREIEKALKEKTRIVTFFDEEYPEELKAIYDPPVLLYVRGRLPDPALPKVAVVGSRVCSLYGRKMAHEISSGLAREGVAVISGLALGIDSAAHEGALAADGITVAVLGGGISKLYPAENKKLAQEIIEKGAVISEYPMQMLPLKQHFPVRNRIISGLSRGVLVVEAKEKSGALITANLALEEGREVFAVPGNADSARSEGTNSLLKQGAKLVTTAGDILEELKMPRVSSPINKTGKPGEKIPLNPDEEKLLSLMDGEALHVDELIEGSGLGPSKVIASLSMLEIKGLVKQLPGKRFIKP